MMIVQLLEEFHSHHVPCECTPPWDHLVSRSSSFQLIGNHFVFFSSFFILSDKITTSSAQKKLKSRHMTAMQQSKISKIR